MVLKLTSCHGGPLRSTYCSFKSKQRLSATWLIVSLDFFFVPGGRQIYIANARFIFGNKCNQRWDQCFIRVVTSSRKHRQKTSGVRKLNNTWAAMREKAAKWENIQILKHAANTQLNTDCLGGITSVSVVSVPWKQCLFLFVYLFPQWAAFCLTAAGVVKSFCVFARLLKLQAVELSGPL